MASTVLVTENKTMKTSKILTLVSTYPMAVNIKMNKYRANAMGKKIKQHKENRSG